MLSRSTAISSCHFCVERSAMGEMKLSPALLTTAFARPHVCLTKSRRRATLVVESQLLQHRFLPLSCVPPTALFRRLGLQAGIFFVGQRLQRRQHLAGEQPDVL